MHPQLEASIASITTSRREIFIHILLIFIAPIVLLQLGIIPLSLRMPLLVVLVTALVFRVVHERWNAKTFGFTFVKMRRFLFPYSLFTLVGVLCIVFISNHIPSLEKATHLWKHSHFLYMFFITSAFQEIAYRGYLIPALGRLTRLPVYIILANTLLFTYLHFIFPNPVVSLPVAFFAGLGFSIMYIRFPSLPLIIFSHAILNFFAVWYGFFVVPGLTY